MGLKRHNVCQTDSNQSDLLRHHISQRKVQSNAVWFSYNNDPSGVTGNRTCSPVTSAA